MAEKKTVVIQLQAKTGEAIKDVDKLNKTINKTNKEANKTGSSFGKFGKSLSGVFSGLGNSISGVIPMLGKLRVALVSTGVGAIVVAIGSLVSLFAKAANIGADFQKSLSTLSAVTGKTADELLSLNQQAKELGSTTQFTAIQVVQLQTELAKLGFTIRDIENSTPAILDLAASLEIDLASAAEFAGSVVRSFGLTTEETQRVVDVMASSTSKSALNFSALQESLKVVAPAARATNVSVEKTAALLGILANNGLKGSVAGTGLSKTFIELNKKGITLEEGMEKVKNSTNKLNTAIELVGQVGAKSFLSLAESGEEINQLESDFINASGAAREMAEVRLDNLAGDTTKLSSAWEGFLLNLEDGDGILNKIQRGGVQLLTKSINGLSILLDYLGFSFKDTWAQTKLVTSATVDFLQGSFKILGNTIKLFANQALLQFSKIPIIGKAIDKDVIKTNIDDAKDAIIKGSETLDEATDKFRQASLNRATFYGRFSASQEAKARRKEEKKQAEIDAKLKEQKQKEDEKLSEEEQKRLEEEREKLAKIEAKTRKQSQDLEDKTEVEKAKRKRERALAELEAVKLSEKEKREAKKAINDYYDTVEKDAQLKDDEARKQKELEASELAAEKLKEDADEEIRIAKFLAEQKKIIQEANLNNIQAGFAFLGRIAGDNKALQAAALIGESAAGIAKTIIQTQASNAATIAQGAALAIPTGGASVALATKLVAANKISAGISIASNIAATAKGLSALKGGGSAPSPSANPSASGGGGGAASLPPAFNVVGASDTNQLADAIGGQSQEPVRAFVVSNDVTTAQSMDRNIVDGASI